MKKKISVSCIKFFLYRPMMIIRRCYSNNIRTHIRRTIKPPKPPISRNLKSIFKTKTIDIRSEIDKFIDENANIEKQWLKILNSKEKINKDQIIEELLKKIINSSEREKDEELSGDINEALINQVIKYDTMYGPKGEGKDNYPNEIRDGIMECREGEDLINMVKIYDIYFTLLKKSFIIKNIERREEVIRNIGINGDYDNGLEKAIEDKRYEEVEELWYKIEKPRNLNIYYSSYNKLMKLIKKEGNKMNGKFIDEFLKDLIISDIGLEYDEIDIMINNIIRFQKFNKEVYEEIKKELEDEFNLKISLDNYLNFFNGALMNNEFKLCEKIIKDIYNEGYLLDRKLIQMMIEYYGKIGDDYRVFKMVEYMIKVNKMKMFSKDWELMINNLMKIGYRSVSIDIIKGLIIIQDGFEGGYEGNDNDNDIDIEYDNKIRDLEIFNTSTKSFENDIIIIKPKITIDMINNILISSENVEEYERLIDIIDNEHNKELINSGEIFKIELMVKHGFEVFTSREIFRECVIGGLNRMKIEEVDKFVSDDESIRVITSICGEWIESEGEDEVVMAYGKLLSGVSDNRERLHNVLIVAGISV